MVFHNNARVFNHGPQLEVEETQKQSRAILAYIQKLLQEIELLKREV